MARHRWTLPLIIVCLPILVTVITAFRVNFPKTSDLKAQKCENCDVNDFKFSQVRSVRSDSGKRSYEELKKASREKQRLLHEQPESSKVNDNDDDSDIKGKISKISNKLNGPLSSDTKSKILKDFSKTKHASDSDDDDNDGIVENKMKPGLKKEGTVTQKVTDLRSKNVVLSPHKLKVTEIENDDDSDDDDDDDDDDEMLSLETKTVPKKVETKIVKSTKNSVTEKNKANKNTLLPMKTKESSMEENKVGEDKYEKTGKQKKAHTDTITKNLQKNDSNDKKSQLKLTKDSDNGDKKSNKEDDDTDDYDVIKVKNKKNTVPAKSTKENLRKISVSPENLEPEDDEDDDDQLSKSSKKIPVHTQKTESQSKQPLKDTRKNTQAPAKKEEDTKQTVFNVDNDDDENSDDNDSDSDDDSTNDIDDKHDDDDDEDDHDDDDDDDADDEDDDDDDDDDEDDSDDDSDGWLSKLWFTSISQDSSDDNKPTESNEVPEKRNNHKVIEEKSLNHVSKTAKVLSVEISKPASKKDNSEKISKHSNPKDIDTKSKINSDKVKKQETVSKEPIPTLKKDQHKDSVDIKKQEEKIKKEAVKPLKEDTLPKSTKTHEVKKTSEEELKKEHNKPEIKVKKIEESTKREESPKVESNIKKTGKDHSTEDKSSQEKLVSSEDVLQKSEIHLKDINDALYRRNLMQFEFEDFYAFLPTFAPNFSRIHNPECRRHGQILLRQLRGSKLWALNMLDATAKIPSGILQGNGIQLGDFDQCLGSRAKVQLDTGSVVKVQGKYCLAKLDVKAEHPELDVPVHLAQAKNIIKSRLDDPGHFVPRFSTLSWGVCIPSACGAEDVEVILKDTLKHYQHTTGIVIRVKVDPEDCHTQDTAEADWEDWLEIPTVVTLSFYLVIILLVLVATIQDYLAGRNVEDDKTDEGSDEKVQPDKQNDGEETKKQDGVLGAFSLYRTVKKLVAPGTEDDIACIHGVRGLATIALLIAHKFLPVAVTPYTNRLKISEVVSEPIWSWCRAGWMYTDCFLLLSGALTAHRITADDSGAPKRLLSRYLRLTPALLAVVLFYAFVWEKIGSGPMWGTLVSKNAEVCQKGWVWNLFYVQNYFGFEDMCAPQTHQLALDMQLTFLGGIIVWTTQVKPGLSLVVFPVLHAMAAYSRYSTVTTHRLTLLAYHGVSVSQLYRTARLSYTSVLHRSTPYLIGLSLGLLLQKPSTLNKFFVVIGWLLSTVLWCAVWWAGYDSGYTTYKYHTAFAAQYATLAPIASATSIAWVIYAVHNGHSEFLHNLLTSWPLVFISRLSYALYLTQFIIFLTNTASIRSSTEFSVTGLIDIQEISSILIVSIILTLTFVIPMQSVPKLFAFSSKPDTEETAEKEEADKNLTEGSKIMEEPSKVETPPQQNQRKPVVVADEIEEIIDNLQHQNKRQHFIAHREVLEEIPEVEVEYEAQRDIYDGLEEILEEEEDGNEDVDEEIEMNENDAQLEEEIQDEQDLEVIDEEEGGAEDFWAEREEYRPRRSFSRQDDRDLDDWEWTNNANNQSGAQYHRYTR